VSDHEDQDSAYLDRVNQDLAQSLRRCHALVDDCRGKLAANSNESNEVEDADDERVG
jgi:uncharacterized membrane protein affecting hemolysin expression